MAHSSSVDQAVPHEESKKTGESMPEWITARVGIRMIINDKGTEAEKLFLQYPDSLIMYAGYAFAIMMDALMSYEEDKLEKAISTLREVETRCSSNESWFKRVTNKVFGASANNNSHTYAEQLETQIILADSQVCIAALTFLQQDFTGYLKGGWVLRKAWKIYQRLYKEILELYEEHIGELHLPSSNGALITNGGIALSTPNADWDIPEHLTNGFVHNSNPFSKSANFNSSEILPPRDPKGSSTKNNLKITTNYSNYNMKKSISLNTALTNYTKNARWDRRSNAFSNSFSLTSISSIFSTVENIRNEKSIEKDVIIRLMGAVSFGYGLFQLGVSLLPPSLIKLINFFGFSTNRENGLACLMYARLGTDMRAPLATLCLLWYHTIVRPFYAVDGTNVQAGVDAALLLLKESEEEFGQSSIFLFYYGRTYRLTSDIKSALAAFQQAMKHASQRELKILCLHEIGWCHLIGLEYCEAKKAFQSLKSSSRWSKAFYSYLSTICTGACDDNLPLARFEEFKSFSDQMPKGIQLDEFLSKRSKRCADMYENVKHNKQIFWKLLIYEMLYLWNALPSCSRDHVSKIIAECSTVKDESDEPMKGLTKLILGCAYNVKKEHKNAITSYRDCLNERRKVPKNSDDAHVSAFAQYELGSLLIKNDETKQEGRLLLQQMAQYNQFDFEQKLHVRVDYLLKQSA